MNRNEAISGLVNYALEKEMIQPEEKAWAVNGLLDILQLDAFSWEEGEKAELTELLDTLLDDAYERAVKQACKEELEGKPSASPGTGDGTF